MANETELIPLLVPDDPYDETGWNANFQVPTKNAVRDKMEVVNGQATGQKLFINWDDTLHTGTGVVAWDWSLGRDAYIDTSDGKYKDYKTTTGLWPQITITNGGAINVGRLTICQSYLSGYQSNFIFPYFVTVPASPDPATLISLVAGDVTEFVVARRTDIFPTKYAWTLGAKNPTINPYETFIRGLIVTKNTTTSINISAGEWWDPTSNSLMSYAGGNTSPSLAASKFYAVYMYNNAGVATVDVQQEDPPSTAYAGTARKRASGNGGRYIGSFLTNTSSQIYGMNVNEIGPNQLEVIYQGNFYDAPFRIMPSGGTATSFTSQSVAAVVPRYIASHVQTNIFIGGATSQEATAGFSLDGVSNLMGLTDTIRVGGSVYLQHMQLLPLNPSTPNFYYVVAGASAIVYVDCIGYRMNR